MASFPILHEASQSSRSASLDRIPCFDIRNSRQLAYCSFPSTAAINKALHGRWLRIGRVQSCGKFLEIRGRIWSVPASSGASGSWAAGQLAHLKAVGPPLQRPQLLVDQP